MKKIENWKEIKEQGTEDVSFVNLEPGQYVAVIKEVIDVVEKEYLKIKFDIIYPEKYKDFFYQQMEKFGEWPSQGYLYRSYKETAQRFFTSFIIAVEKSNDNFTWNFDETKLVGKKFVANFGEEEYENQEGDIKVSLKCREVRSTKAYKEGKVKDLKFKALPGRERTEDPQTNLDEVDESLPF